MAYQIQKFTVDGDDVLLPTLNPEQDHSPGAVDSTLLDSIGGVFAAFGTNHRAPRKQQFAVSGIYWGETVYETDHNGNYIADHNGNLITFGSDAAYLRGQLDAILSKRGAWGDVVRVRLDDETVEQTKTCQLMAVPYQQTVTDRDFKANVSCQFETQQVNWRDANATTISASLTAGVGAYLYAHNDGDVSLDDAIITIARTSGTISAVSLIGAGIDLSWTGAIGSGNSLVIDCGLQTVRIGTSDEYDGFCINDGHTVAGWLPMALGDTGLQATVTGGSATYSISWYNQWA